MGVDLAVIAQVAAVASSAASVGGAVLGAQEAKRAKKARLRQARLEQEIRERRLRAERRKKTADLFSRAAFTGAGTSDVFTGAVKALETSETRELQTSSTLADINRSQIRSDFTKDIISTISTGIEGVATGANKLDTLIGDKNG